MATFAFAVLAFAAISVLAQDEPDPVAEAGRLSYLSGSVSIQQAGSDDWNRAYPNFPLGPGDRIFTDWDGRAEIQVGETYLRIGPNSDVSFIDAAPYGVSFGVAQGAVHVNCHGLWQGQYLHVNTPNGNATIDRPGEFRVDVMPDDDAAIFTGLSDDAFISGAGGFGQHLGNWQSIELIGSNPVYPEWLQPSDPDGLDGWSRDRDRQIANSISYRYVSREIPGAAELDANGDWVPDTDYGPVWFPRNVSYDWSPYHNGHWVNHDPWGWVWVEDESWGYAPFHYGRWITMDGRWGWVPGPPSEHPVWSPALVVFAGGIHVGGGGVSVWFPLGPGEAYRPWYHASPRYIDQVNISNIHESRQVHVQKTYVNIVNVTNVTNVTNITYINRNVGATAMRQEDFAAGRPAQQTAVKVDPHQLEHIQVLARPEPKPIPRPVVAVQPAHPVPVKLERPVFINEQGKQISAKPGAKPIDPPVKAVAPAKTLPGRAIVAPPPGATARPASTSPVIPPRPNANPPLTPAPTTTPTAPNKPVANPVPQAGAKPATPPVANPNPQAPPIPNARPNPNPPTQPNARPVPPAANPNPQAPPIPNARPNPNQNPPQQPNVKPLPTPSANPTPQPTPTPYARPNPNPPPQPNVKPVPPPAANPNTQTPPPSYTRPNPNPSPSPAVKPVPPPQPQPAPKPAPKPYTAPPPPAPPAAQPAPKPATPPAAKPTQPPPPQAAKPDKEKKDKNPE